MSEPVVKNAVRCMLCGASVDRYKQGTDSGYDWGYYLCTGCGAHAPQGIGTGPLCFFDLRHPEENQ